MSHSIISGGALQLLTVVLRWCPDSRNLTTSDLREKSQFFKKFDQQAERSSNYIFVLTHQAHHMPVSNILAHSKAQQLLTFAKSSSSRLAVTYSDLQYRFPCGPSKEDGA
eukprot:s719_g23.t1